MATFASFKQYSGAIDQMAKDIENETKGRIALTMAERAKSIALAAASADLGGDPKFSGWAPALEIQIKKIKTGYVVIPTKKSAGPWTVAEYGRHNHGNPTGFQGPGIGKKTGLTKKLKSGKVGKVKTVKAKKWNGVTKGKGTASRAVVGIDVELPRMAEAGVLQVQMRHFDVT